MHIMYNAVALTVTKNVRDYLYFVQVFPE